MKPLAICPYEDCGSKNQRATHCNQNNQTVTYQITCMDCKRKWVMSIRLDI